MSVVNVERLVEHSALTNIQARLMTFNPYEFTDPKDIYKDLMTLCAVNKSFEFKDIDVDDVHYRIFNYRLASYTEFLAPSALEARGIMFEILPDGSFKDIVCRPFNKFFNYNENPSTTGLNLDYRVKQLIDKMDGTLLSSFLHKGRYYLKTRRMINVEQVHAAQKLLGTNDYASLWRLVRDATLAGYTVMMEYTAPDNKIVVDYSEPELWLLAIRHNESGNYVNLDEALDINEQVFLPNQADLPQIKMDHASVWSEDQQTRDGITNYLTNVMPKETGAEGYVAVLDDGRRMKFKNDWYQLRHSSLDVIHTPKRLFEHLLDEKYDELMTIHSGSAYMANKINKMYDFIKREMNRMQNHVESLHSLHKTKDRKDYAITIKELTKSTIHSDMVGNIIFGACMDKYLGREVDYIDMMLKRWKVEYRGMFLEKEPMNVDLDA